MDKRELCGMLNREVRLRLEQELFTLQKDLKPRLDRCRYVHAQLLKQQAIKNIEQAEAYSERLHRLKVMVLPIVEKIDQLERRLKAS